MLVSPLPASEAFHGGAHTAAAPPSEASGSETYTHVDKHVTNTELHNKNG